MDFFKFRFHIWQRCASAHLRKFCLWLPVVHAEINRQSKSRYKSHPQAALRCRQPVSFFHCDWVTACPSQKRLPAAQFQRVTLRREKKMIQRTGKVNRCTNSDEIYCSQTVIWIWFSNPGQANVEQLVEFYFGGVPNFDPFLYPMFWYV